MTEIGTIFTIGHSTHAQEDFIDLLRLHSVTALCDVRSKPYSGRNPQFNRDELEHSLMRLGIEYRFFGRELGARSDDPTCYYKGKIQYEQLAKTELFQRGLKRVLRGMKQGFRIVLMCAEREPLECHRSILVARHLDSMGLEIQHIHANGRLENHSAAIARLIRMLYVMEDDMFLSPEEMLEMAYRRQAERIAYELNDDDFKKRAAG